MTTCRRCAHEVPALEFCVRCGHPLDDDPAASPGDPALRDQYAAAPEEGAVAVRIISTLFPQLPRADMETFRWALIIGLAAVIGLAVAGIYPVALLAAAILVPLLMVLYLYDVDVYEDEPIRIIALTMAWGALAGAVVGLLAAILFPLGTSITAGPSVETVVARGVLVPLVGGALMLLGPLALLRYPKFNDVLDGATFGAAAAVSFVGAQALTNAMALFSAGLRPAGEPLPWVARLLELGLAQPLLAAGVMGAATGAYWLRFRTPSDRNRLGILGSPAAATLLALAALVVAAVGRLLLSQAIALLWLAVLAAVALVWLRRVIHVGLLQEASEIELQGTITCANCRRTTPYHSFCGHCGVSLRALPKSRGVRPPTTDVELAGDR